MKKVQITNNLIKRCITLVNGKEKLENSNIGERQR